MGAFSRFIEAKKVRPCQDETTGRVFVGSKSATASTSYGANTVAAASARQALQTANKLKRSSANGFMPVDAEAGRVIPMKSS